jgi:hypothetical protein
MSSCGSRRGLARRKEGGEEERRKKETRLKTLARPRLGADRFLDFY